VISNVYGSYLGFIEFEGVRYWDARDIPPIKYNVINSTLESDHSKR